MDGLDAGEYSRGDQILDFGLLGCTIDSFGLEHPSKAGDRPRMNHLLKLAVLGLLQVTSLSLNKG